MTSFEEADMRTIAVVLAALVPFTARAEVLAPASAAPPPAAAAVPTVPPPDLHARIYVKDLDHLAEILKEDPGIGARADDLAARAGRARSVGLTGGLVGSLLFAAGGMMAVNDVDSNLDSPTFGQRTSSRGPALMVVGTVTALASIAYAMTQAPRRDELIDVLNDWNAQHPDRPLDVAFLVPPVIVYEQAPPAWAHDHHP